VYYNNTPSAQNVSWCIILTSCYKNLTNTTHVIQMIQKRKEDKVGWEQTEEHNQHLEEALNTKEQCRSVTQCIHLDAGWIKVKLIFSLCSYR